MHFLILISGRRLDNADRCLGVVSCEEETAGFGTWGRTLVHRRGSHGSFSCPAWASVLRKPWSAARASGGWSAYSSPMNDQTLIIDTGFGICSELREAIFRRGFSTKGEHRGLGLALVKELVDLSGGGSTWSRMRADGVHHRRRGRSARCSRFTS